MTRRRKLLLAAVPLLVLAAPPVSWMVGELRDAAIPIDSPFHPFRSPEARERFLARYDQRARAWPVPAREHRVETSWGSTFVRTSGPSGAPPLVLLHGIGGSSLQWLPNVADLAERFRVHAVDAVYDKGRSVPTRRLRSEADLQAWLDETIDGLEPTGRVHLVGLSYGGWLAARYAVRRPDRVDGLVLLAPVATIRPLPLQWLARAALAALPLRSLTERFVLWQAADLAATEAGRRLALEHAADAYLAHRTFKPAQVVAPRVFSDEDLARLPDATLVVVGENETIYDPREVVDRLHRVAPEVEVVLLEDAGHDLTMVRPEAVSRLVVGFLAETGGAEVPIR